MNARLLALTELAQAVQQRPPVDELLRLVVEHSARIMDVDHASVRLLDPSSSSLVAACRSGEQVNERPLEFRRGEGLLGWVAAQGQALCVVDPAKDPRFVKREGSRPIKSFAGAPLRAGQQVFGVLSAVALTRAMELDELMYLQLIAAICAPHLEIARLSRLSQVDPLTGSLNRRGFDLLFPDERDEAPGGASPAPAGDRAMCVVLVDIDHFKLVNDEHGHALGDDVLRKVARILASSVRVGDEIVRLGGEEFLMVLPGLDIEAARMVAERARQMVESNSIEIGGRQVRITISLGVAQRHAGERRDDLVARADRAMYAAKTAGRNCVVLG